MIPTSFLYPWLVTWLILAVVFFIVADALQRYFYDFVVDRLGWRVMLVTPILAAVLVRWPLTFQDLFLHFANTVVQVVLWFLVCWMALRFQLTHAVVLAVLAVALVAPIASSAVDSLFGSAAGSGSAAVARDLRPVASASGTAGSAGGSAVTSPDRAGRFPAQAGRQIAQSTPALQTAGPALWVFGIVGRCLLRA